MNNENITLDKPPAYIPICSGMIGSGVMGFVLLGTIGLYAGILVGFLIGISFYIRDKMYIE